MLLTRSSAMLVLDSRTRLVERLEYCSDRPIISGTLVDVHKALKNQQNTSRLFTQMRSGMNVVALPVDNGYVTLGHLVEHVVEAIRTDGTPLGLFSSAVAAAAALVEAARTAQQANDATPHVRY